MTEHHHLAESRGNHAETNVEDTLKREILPDGTSLAEVMSTTGAQGSSALADHETPDPDAVDAFADLSVIADDVDDLHREGAPHPDATPSAKELLDELQIGRAHV